MENTEIKIPGFDENGDESPIVFLGPNGSGKTQLAQKIAKDNQVSAISAQRRIWVDDSLPVQREDQLRSQVKSQQDRWQNKSWHPTEEINHVLSTLIQDHTNRLTKKNEEALDSGKPFDPVNDTNLILLQGLWKRLFPKRKLEIGGFFPRVNRLDIESPSKPYLLREMSDGERTVLYMAARVMTAEQPVILVDEPELHMHSRLSVQFWDEAEKLRPDCRFIYLTHDLNFALSRRNATYVIVRSVDETDAITVDELPSSIAAEVLGAATLPFYAKRIFFFEGEPGQGFASEFFSAWFDGEETFSIPSGNRNSVCSAVSGLNTVGVVAAEIIGLVDRDFYSEEVLNSVPSGVTVLQLHEIESVLCDRRVASCLSEQLGKNPSEVWDKFLDKTRTVYQGKSFNFVVANRVRARVKNLLDGAFKDAQIVEDCAQTAENHCNSLIELDFPGKAARMFNEESQRVKYALSEGGKELLGILPGKHLLGIFADALGLRNTTELTSMVIRALNRKHLNLKKDDPLISLGDKLESALVEYLPPRQA